MRVHVHSIFAFFLGCIASTATILLLQAIQSNDSHTAQSYLKENSISLNRRAQIVNGYSPGYLQSVNAPNRMLIGIFSIMEEKEIRNKLREYIFRNPERADPRLCSLPEFIEKEEEGLLNECQVIYTFVVGANTSSNGHYIHTDASKMPILVNTQYIKDAEPDVTYLNIHENMNKGKSPTWFKYASELSRSFGMNGFNYIGKLDSDTLISIPNLIHMINHDLPSEAKNVYGGLVCDEMACGNPTRCHEILQGKLYMTGQFYFLSLDLASYVSSDALERADISSYSEDVDMGLWVHSSNQIIKLVILNNKNVFWIHNVKDLERFDEKYTDYFLRQRKFPMYSFWLRPKWWD